MIVESHSHIDLPLEGAEEPTSFHYGKRLEGVEQYLQTYDRNGVDACWVFGSRSFRESGLIAQENTALGALRSQYPHRLFSWGSVNPNWPERQLRAEIGRVATDLRLHGIKLVPLLQGFAMSAGGMDIVAEEATRHGLPVFVHDGSPEYCSAIQTVYLARNHPALQVVSGHGGLRELWRDLAQSAGDLPNLWICLSGPTQWGIQKLYDMLGHKRLLFGSDGGLGNPAIVKAYLRRLDHLDAPPEHKRAILGENAMRFLFGEGWRNHRRGQTDR